MKILFYVFAIGLFAVIGCKKQLIGSKTQSSASPPLMYVVLDQSGKNILDTLGLAKDSLTLTSSVNGISTEFCDSIFYAFKKNNKVVAYDYEMIRLSSENASNPGYTFDLSYHGQKLGVIYFKYSNLIKSPTDSWQKASVFTFNNAPVQLDTTGGGHVYVIKLQP
jgi:hypothetical protein